MMDRGSGLAYNGLVAFGASLGWVGTIDILVSWARCDVDVGACGAVLLTRPLH
jgi:hypothetical protein